MFFLFLLISRRHTWHNSAGVKICLAASPGRPLFNHHKQSIGAHDPRPITIRTGGGSSFYFTTTRSTPTIVGYCHFLSQEAKTETQSGGAPPPCLLENGHRPCMLPHVNSPSSSPSHSHHPMTDRSDGPDRSVTVYVRTYVLACACSRRRTTDGRTDGRIDCGVRYGLRLPGGTVRLAGRAADRQGQAGTRQGRVGSMLTPPCTQFHLWGGTVGFPKFTLSSIPFRSVVDLNIVVSLL